MFLKIGFQYHRNNKFMQQEINTFLYYCKPFVATSFAIFLLLLILFFEICHCSFYKLTYSVLQEKLTCSEKSAACFLYGNGINSGWLISFKTKWKKWLHLQNFLKEASFNFKKLKSPMFAFEAANLSRNWLISLQVKFAKIYAFSQNVNLECKIIFIPGSLIFFLKYLKKKLLENNMHI